MSRSPRRVADTLADVTGNGHVVATQLVVKLANEIGFGGPFTAEEVREEISKWGKRKDDDPEFSNVEWIKEWDGVTPGRDRPISDFL
jgi:hypothetical protein